MLSAPSQGCCGSLYFVSQSCFFPPPPTIAVASSSVGISGMSLYSCTRSCKFVYSGSSQPKRFPLWHHRRLSMTCKGSPRRNPDFSRKQRGSSKSRSKQLQECDDPENSEETDFISSKNGSLLSLSNNPRYQATTILRQREKEIVELFRKVQAQLREQAAIKEEKKIEAAQQGKRERETVDSLLKLLRKHSVDQRKTISTEEDLNHVQTENSNVFEDEQKLNFPIPNNVMPEKVDEANPPPSSRPVSNFKRRSHVPRMKFQPLFSAEEEISSTSVEDTSSTCALRPKGKRKKASGKESKLQTDSEPSLVANLDELFVNDQFGISGSNETNEDSTQSSIGDSSGSPDLASLKLVELRDLAKS